MNTVQEIKDALGRITRGERQNISLWIAMLAADRAEDAAVFYDTEPEDSRLSVEKYLELEDEGGLHHEYADGVIYAMSSPSIAHGLIVGDLHVALYSRLRGTPCIPYLGNVKVRFKVNHADVVYCPDLMVACGRDGAGAQYLRFPKLIIEVLSPATERIDRCEKLMTYTQLDSVEEYVLVAEDVCEVTVHRREEGWTPQVLSDPEAVLEFQSIGLSLPLARIYERVALEA